MRQDSLWFVEYTFTFFYKKLQIGWALNQWFLHKQTAENT